MTFTAEQLKYADDTAKAFYAREASKRVNEIIDKAYRDAITGGTGHWTVNPRYLTTGTGEKIMPNKTPFAVYDFIDEVIKPPKKDYSTVGVRFLQGPNLHQVYTYRVRKGAKLRLGQEVVVPTQREVLANTIAVVVELHKTPQDTKNFDYKFVAGTVQPL
jgi:3'DNA-binding domain (3'BD)